MNHCTRLTSKLFAFSVIAVAFGLPACGGGESHANAPSNAQGASNTDVSGSSTAATGPSGAQGLASSNTGMPSTGTTATSTPGASTTGAAGSTGATTGAGAGQYGSTNTMGGSADAATLDDPQIAAVVAAINDGEIQEGQLAATKATSPAVKNFARHMITAHRTLQTKDTTTLSKAQITPSDNTLSNQLKTDAQSQLSELQSLKGKDFDRQYIDDQVKGHTKALQLVDTALTTVKNAELKADLTAARPQIEDHLRMAEKVQQQLASGGTGTTGGGSMGSGAGSMGTGGGSMGTGGGSMGSGGGTTGGGTTGGGTGASTGASGGGSKGTGGGTR